jgi:hypothetical protein
MSERNPFGREPARKSGLSREPLTCEQWEDLLTDALDQTLPATERAAFEEHHSGCDICARLLTESKQGQEWLQFLGSEPEVPSDMVERILGRTSGVVAGGPLAVAGAAPVAVSAGVLGLPVRRFAWDSRMMMTAAMAFFSIALTLNLAGVRLTNLRLSDLTPASMETNLTRQFYGAKGSVVRYYDNLRLVYEVESKMREIRRAEDMQQTQPEQKQDVPANPQGNGQKNGGKLQQPEGLLWGSPVLANEEGPESPRKLEESAEEEANSAALCDRVQAERSLA